MVYSYYIQKLQHLLLFNVMNISMAYGLGWLFERNILEQKLVIAMQSKAKVLKFTEGSPCKWKSVLAGVKRCLDLSPGIYFVSVRRGISQCLSALSSPSQNWQSCLPLKMRTRKERRKKKRRCKEKDCYPILSRPTCYPLYLFIYIHKNTPRPFIQLQCKHPSRMKTEPPIFHMLLSIPLLNSLSHL